VRQEATPEPKPLASLLVRDILGNGEMTVHGRIAGSSNATLLVSCSKDDHELLAIYKPTSGERHLWDFPTGLYRREIAAYELSEALGWNLVPETIQREEAPFGVGSVQRFVHEDGESHYFTLRENPRWEAQLMKICAFDVVANNADRKSGHVLLADGQLWGIDHGLCFHDCEKLRTVMWDFAGVPLPDEIIEDVSRFAALELPASLAELLDTAEQGAVIERARDLVAAGEFPTPDEDAPWPPYPWPLV
jgi:uncharacterized repeat protein (TIGR03843 family)